MGLMDTDDSELIASLAAPDHSAAKSRKRGVAAKSDEAADADESEDRRLAEKLQAELNAEAAMPRREKRRRTSATVPSAGEAGVTASDDEAGLPDWARNITDEEESDDEISKPARGSAADDDEAFDVSAEEDEMEDDENEDDSEGELEPDDVLMTHDAPAPPRGRRPRQRRQHAAVSRRDSAVTSEDGNDTWTSLSSSQQQALQMNEMDDVVLEGGLRVPGNIHDNLLDYQRTGLTWMWELHQQRVGGIIGDEMGLGKTIQVIAMLGSLAHSELLRAPSIVVAPATLLQQWSRELETWAPYLPVVVYHDSSGAGASAEDLHNVYEAVSASADPGDDGGDDGGGAGGRGRGTPGLIITTYDQVRTKLEALLSFRWQYLILDEGHKIRNPDARITLAVKQFDTPHRLIMSGSPIQNNLTELWSLFDFVLPGKLGTLPVFKEQFEAPITLGGYSNASSVMVETAYRCSVVLRDLIGPYLLRRMKKDVGTTLPGKTEQILFCSLSAPQRAAYLDFLGTDEMRSTLVGRRKPFSAITELRKICNHPDLAIRMALERPEDYGAPARSGKMLVTEQIMTMWHSQKHRALLFSQTKQMLDIIEMAVQTKGWSYRRMDGGLPIKQRLAMIDEYHLRNIMIMIGTPD
jgi:DNA excision repair protein ERCC-6